MLPIHSSSVFTCLINTVSQYTKWKPEVTQAIHYNEADNQHYETQSASCITNWYATHNQYLPHEFWIWIEQLGKHPIT